MYTTQDDRPPSVTSECIMSYIARWQRHKRRPKQAFLAITAQASHDDSTVNAAISIFYIYK